MTELVKECEREREEYGEKMEKVTIGENTTVKVGIIISFLAIFGSSIWWASSINSKLDSILASQNSFVNSTTTTITELKDKDLALDRDISDFRLKQALFEVDLKTIKEKASIK